MGRARTGAIVALCAAGIVANAASPAAAARSGSSPPEQRIPVTVSVEGTPADQIPAGTYEGQLLAGPCDGQGACHVQLWQDDDFSDGSINYDATPGGDGYQTVEKPDVDWGPCPPGDTTVTYTLAIQRSGGRITVSGTKVDDPHHEDITEIPGKTCVYRHVTTTFEGSGAISSNATTEPGASGQAASSSDSGGTPAGLIGAGALVVIGAGIAALAVLRRRRPKATVAPTGPPAAFEVRATADASPRITIEMTAGGTTARPD